MKKSQKLFPKNDLPKITFYHSFFIKKIPELIKTTFKLMETGARGILGAHAPLHVAKE